MRDRHPYNKLSPFFTWNPQKEKKSLYIEPSALIVLYLKNQSSQMLWMLNSPRNILADCCVAPSTLNTWKGKTLKAFKSQLLLKACKWLEMTGKFLPVAASCPVTGSAAHCLAPLSKRCSLQCRRSVHNLGDSNGDESLSYFRNNFRIP